MKPEPTDQPVVAPVLIDREEAAKVGGQQASAHKPRCKPKNGSDLWATCRHCFVAAHVERAIRALPPYTTAAARSCLHCDPSFKPSGPDGWCVCACHAVSQAPAAAQPVVSVRVLIALDEDARVRECVVLTDRRQADELFHRLQKIWGGANVAMASRAVDALPANLHERIAEITEIIQ